MRKSALLVLAAVALPCAGCSTNAAIAADDPRGSSTNVAVAADDPPVVDVDNADGTGLVCSEDTGDAASVGEAQEPLSGLSIACLLLVSVAVEIGCNEAVIDGWCPPGTTKTIHDTWDNTKTMTISCDVLRYVVCGGAAAGGVELMRRACLAV